jgi:hypothetical protein
VGHRDEEEDLAAFERGELPPPGYLLASCVLGRYRGQARRALILALTTLARTLADLRAAQDQWLQSAAACHVTNMSGRTTRRLIAVVV